MSSKFGAAVFVVMACAFGPMTAGAQGNASVKVGKDGSVKVRAGDTAVDARGGGAHVQAGDTEVDAQGGETGTVVDSGDGTLEISGSGSKETHRCGPNTEVDISGASNVVTLTGECKRVSVSGSSNEVKVEAVGSIDVTGTSNNVTWKRGLGKAKPKVSRTGIGNKVSQEK